MGVLISLQIFSRHVVLADLFRVNFRHVGIGSIFHTANRFGLEILTLFEQFDDAF